jgi:hypothetical protein
MKKLYRNFTFDLTIAMTALVLGIVMLPPFGIGIYMLNILLAASIVVYFLVYLWDKLRVTRGSIFLLTALECVVYLFVIIDLILEQFRLYDALNVCRALGIILWTRGTVSAIGMYINAISQNRRKNNLPGFLFRIFLICVGMYLLANPLINDRFLNWAICILFYLSALAFGGLALLFSPTKKK